MAGRSAFSAQFSVPLARREFLAKAAAMGLSAAALAAFSHALVKTVAPRTAGAAPASGPLGLDALSFPNTTEARIGHLLRRAGFGASRAELDRFVSMGLQATIDHLLDYEKVDNSALDQRLAARTYDFTNPRDVARWWTVRMVHTARPLEEKMTFFWHSILTSGASKVGRGPWMYLQNRLLRQHALASYDVMLKAVSKDPAMLIWLDGRVNRRGAPNENYARELMELFSMGPGNYTEQDVREAARACTGWNISVADEEAIFNRGQFDNTPKTFLGQTGNFNGDNIVDIILQQPAAHRFMGRLLFEFFVYDAPPLNTEIRLAQVFRESGYSIKALLRDIFSSAEFYSDRAYRAKAKSPAEFVVSTYRILGLDADRANLHDLATTMGQTLLDPPDVSGWPGGDAWFTSTTLLNRINFAHRIARAYRDQLQRGLGNNAAALTGAALQQRIAAIKALLLDGYLPQEEDLLLRTFTDQMSSSSSLPARNRGIEALGAATYLLMASPDYQLA
jgi:uncharacterized protein (DUF1800 family)